jgi:site-specific recombinase XerD
LEAIAIWLAEVAKTESTLRSYRLEVERCLLWATVERRKALSELDDDDIRQFARFLIDPQPYTRWVRTGHSRRDAEDWRPFCKPLSSTCAERALRIISCFFEWLEEGGYIPESPWRGPTLIGRRFDKQSIVPAMSTERSANVVTAVEWAYVRKSLEELSANLDRATDLRCAALFYLAYFADLKPGEIASLRASAITLLASDPLPVWKMSVEGRKAGREIVLLPPLVQALERYLSSRGLELSSNIQSPDFPVLASSRGANGNPDLEASLSERSLFSIAKPVFIRAATLAQHAGDFTAARRLSLASIQWLRHAFEVHVAHSQVSGGWDWLLLGSCWLTPWISREYLPPRTPLSLETVLDGFEELQVMWAKNPSSPLELDVCSEIATLIDDDF